MIRSVLQSILEMMSDHEWKCSKTEWSQVESGDRYHFPSDVRTTEKIILIGKKEFINKMWEIHLRVVDPKTRICSNCFHFFHILSLLLWLFHTHFLIWNVVSYLLIFCPQFYASTFSYRLFLQFLYITKTFSFLPANITFLTWNASFSPVWAFS